MQWIYVILAVLYQIIIILAIVHVVLDNRQPAKTMSWALVIYFVPVAGLVLYLFFGVNTRKERLINQRQLDQLSKRSMLGYVEQQNLTLPEQHKPLIDLFINESFSLPFKDSQAEIYTDGYQFFPELLAAIAGARHHIHIDMYIMEDDPLGRLVSDALIARARSGVEVRIIYDDVGCWSVKNRFFERLREEGIEVMAFLPVRFPSFTSKANYRNHRKLIVIDGTTGYVGGMNIALRYVKGIGKGGSTPWRDTMVRITGLGVHALQRAFLIDWYFVDRTLITNRDYYPTAAMRHDGDTQLLMQLVTSAPTSPYPSILQGFVYAISTARRYIYIETPYFLPNEPVLFALKNAVLAGVDVCLLCPRRSDARFTEWACRSYLRELHETGARIFLYDAGFMHSKVMIIDDSFSTCGSTNVDFRSFENNFESNVFFYDEQTARRLRSVFEDDLSHSVAFGSVHEWSRPSFLHRLIESLTRVFSPLL